MSDNERRKAPRFTVELPVIFLDAKTDEPHLTVDVSRGGMFVATDKPRPLRQLVRMRIDIPSEGEVIEVHGMVVHSRGPGDVPEDGRPPGIGIEFFGFGGQPRHTWEALLRRLQTGSPVGPGPAAEVGTPLEGEFEVSTVDPIGSHIPDSYGAPPTTPSAPAIDPPPHQADPGARAKVVCRVFPVPLQSAEQLYELYERELVTGTMFVCTPVKVPVGDRVVLRVQHPNSGEAFDLHGLVETVHDDPTYPGLTLALRPSTMARRPMFKQFVDRGVPLANAEYDLDFDD